MPGMAPLTHVGPGDLYAYLIIDLGLVAALTWLASSLSTGWATPRWLRRWLVTEGVPVQSRARAFLFPALGAVWILDGLLQAQPAMPYGFPREVVGSTLLGQPHWLVSVLSLGAFFWRAHPLDLSAGTALLQIGIGLAILAGGDSALGRAGVWSSVGWGLVVWVGGEGMGGLLAPRASLLMGSPGSALAYVAIAAILLAPATAWEGGKMGRRIRVGVGALLLLGGALQALPWEGFWSGPALGRLLLGMARTRQPGALAAPMVGGAHLVLAQPALANLLVTASMVALGVGLLVGRAPRLWSLAAILWFAASWWLGQDFGQLGSGVSTDLNLAPLVALLLVGALMGLSGERRVPVKAAASGLRRTLALGGVCAIAVGVVPVLLGLPMAASELVSSAHPAALLAAETPSRPASRPDLASSAHPVSVRLRGLQRQPQSGGL